MFKIDELAGSLVKSGRFAQAAELFADELDKALVAGVLTREEAFGTGGIVVRFANICLNPSKAHEVEKLGNDLIYIALRIPYYVQKA